MEKAYTAQDVSHILQMDLQDVEGLVTLGLVESLPVARRGAGAGHGSEKREKNSKRERK